MNETHLSPEERLLLADGELAAERVAHLDACPECAAAFEAFDATLKTATAALRSEVAPEPVEAHGRSWARLAAAIERESGVAEHLGAEELLLQVDEELEPERAAHLEGCAECHAALLETQAFLFDLEHELRALIPSEPRESRLRSAGRLDRELYPRKKKVVSFPVRWGVVYAAAAALTFAVFGGLWYSEIQVEAPTVAFAPPPAPAVEPAGALIPAPPAPNPAPATIAAERAPARSEEQATPDRFVLASNPDPAPAPAAVKAETLSLRAAVAAPRLDFVAPARPAEPAVESPPAMRTLARAPEKIDWVNRPAGGLARTALVEHYRDAARRSFRSPTPSLVESEIARFTNDVFRSQSALLDESYALEQLLADASPALETADPQARKKLRKAIDERLDAIERHESVIYSRLSEVLPRKYWSHHVERDSIAESPAAAEDLLDAALALEENLAVLLSDASASLDAGAVSPGAALARVRADVRALRSWSRDLQ